MQCPACRGYGGEREVILDDGTGPWYDCGFCRGRGYLTNRKYFYRVLGWISAAKRREKKDYLERLAKLQKHLQQVD